MLAWKLSLAVVAATTLLAASAARAEDEGPTTVVVGSVQVDSAPGSSASVATPRSDYWLGVFASPPSPALQAQLKLPKNQGIVVEDLEPESPASKAGVKQYDILLKGNDKPLSGLHDLFELINQVKDGKLKLELLRAGKQETVTVTPAKRPAQHVLDKLGKHNGEMAGGWILNPDSNGPEAGSLHFRIIGPGQILPGGPLAALPGGGSTPPRFMIHTKLADGSNVEITRQGAEPANVTVTRDKEKWEGTSADLSKIPEKIRPEVEKLLQPAFDHNRVFAGPGETLSGPVTIFGSAMAAPGLAGPLVVSHDFEKRLDEMQKQINELRHSVDALQGKDKKAAPKPE
jgi:hypothetical protein